jgi:hypothetical protein
MKAGAHRLSAQRANYHPRVTPARKSNNSQQLNYGLTDRYGENIKLFRQQQLPREYKLQKCGTKLLFYTHHLSKFVQNYGVAI